jgi:hypothetical protein
VRLRPRRSPGTLTAPPPAGTEVRVVFSKWGGGPHWEYDALLLGEDDAGTWLGAPAGTRLARPGADFVSDQDFVSLVPHEGCYVATFYGETPRPATDRAAVGPGWVEVYVDVTTRPQWHPGPTTTVRMVDLDLDVLRGRSGRVWVDDEDEFADHRQRLGYPEDVVAQATSTCEAVRDAVSSRRPPYDGVVGAGWLSRLARTRPAGA